MSRATEPIAVLLESGGKRTIASAIEWPGWARGGRGEEAALAQLAAYGSRYRAVLQAAGIAGPPEDAPFAVEETVAGDSGTDYGVPSIAIARDAEPLTAADLARLAAILAACWTAFATAVERARGVELATGPRGGGRDLDGIVAHVLEAERMYIGVLGGSAPKVPAPTVDALATVNAASVEALHAKARGELPEVGARGGRRWAGRYFVRRAAWHVLDHAWEIEDRAAGPA